MGLITGNTFAVKDALKHLGGRWDAQAKGWQVPDERAEEAQALVDKATYRGPGIWSSTWPRNPPRTSDAAQLDAEEQDGGMDIDCPCVATPDTSPCCVWEGNQYACACAEAGLQGTLPS